MKLIFPMLVANHYKRAMVLGTCSYPAPQDKGGLKWKLCVALVKLVGGSAYQEFRGLGEYIASQDLHQLRWTLFRVPFLTNGAEGAVNATYTGSGDDGLFLSRKSLVRWVLQEMCEDSSWTGKAPAISNHDIDIFCGLSPGTQTSWASISCLGQLIIAFTLSNNANWAAAATFSNIHGSCYPTQ